MRARPGQGEHEDKRVQDHHGHVWGHHYMSTASKHQNIGIIASAFDFYVGITGEQIQPPSVDSLS